MDLGALPPLDTESLTTIVRRIVADPAAIVSEWRVASLGYRVINGITGGLWRVSGEARSGGREVGWSTVLKVLRRAGEGSAANFAPSDDPEHWNYWRREALVYGSKHLADLSPGLVAPRVYGVVEPDAESAWLWLEDIAGVPARDWSDARWGLLGRQLGRWQGAYATGARRLPAEPWLCRGHLRSWVPTEPGVALEAVREPGVWAHPLLRDHLPSDTGARVARLWAEQEGLLAVAERTPLTLCHLDLWSRNLLSWQTPCGDEETVLLDWSMLGFGVLGEDIANLVLDSTWMLDVAGDPLPQFESVVLDGYLAGLRDAGWNGDERDVRAAYAAIGALRFGLLAGPVLAQARDEERHATLEARYGRPIAEVIARRAAVVRRGLELMAGYRD